MVGETDVEKEGSVSKKDNWWHSISEVKLELLKVRYAIARLKLEKAYIDLVKYGLKQDRRVA